MTPILKWSDLSLAINGRRLFGDFSGAMEPGEKVFLSGPSGCGKSTFLRIILGFFPEYRGVVSVNGVPLSPETVWNIRRQTAWLPQEADIGGYATAGDFIRSCFQYAANRKTHDPVDFWLDAFRLPSDILLKPADVLSGGEKQRLALAAVLTLNRPLILLDEPLSALDAASALAVTDALSALPNTAILAVSHLPFPEKVFRKITLGETT